jgi:hypothetical protein
MPRSPSKTPNLESASGQIAQRAQRWRYCIVDSIALRLRGVPRATRWGIVGAGSVGTLGAIVGLVVGLHAYAPTAPFAVIELGLPATLAGGFVGLIAGLIVTAGCRVTQGFRRGGRRSGPR